MRGTARVGALQAIHEHVIVRGLKALCGLGWIVPMNFGCSSSMPFLSFRKACWVFVLPHPNTKVIITSGNVRTYPAQVMTEYWGQRLAGLTHEIMLKAKRGCPGRQRGRSPGRAASVQLRRPELQAGHVLPVPGLCGQHANFAGVATATARRRGGRARSPQAWWRAERRQGWSSLSGAPSCPPLVFQGGTLCTSAWTRCAAGATGWPTPPLLPILARPTASMWRARCRTWALRALQHRQSSKNMLTWRARTFTFWSTWGRALQRKDGLARVRSTWPSPA